MKKEAKELGDDAKVLLFSLFSVSTVLTMQNIESRLTDRAAEAMTELIGAGYIEAKKADNINALSMSYTRTDKDVGNPPSFEWLSDHSKHFLLSEKIKRT